MTATWASKEMKMERPMITDPKMEVQRRGVTMFTVDPLERVPD